MRGLTPYLVALLQATSVLALPSPAAEDVTGLATRDLDVRDLEPLDLEARDLEARAACRTSKNRACWSPGFDINTDYEAKVPHTGVTRNFVWTVTEHDNWVGSDGLVKEKAMLINGGFPGPQIRANWGDMIHVTVTNKLRINGTSIHWHGVRMLNNNVNDGTNGVTECPIPPGGTKTYKFLAEQYGTSWYHSHFSSQYANGVAGTIIIDGPASANYDIDLGALSISDWYYKSADHIQIANNALPPSPPPPSDNILFNGRHVNAQGGGAYTRLKLTRGKTHRLHIVNPSVENTFTVSLVNHKLTVIETDFVPVQPTTRDSLYVDLGQRYEVLIKADQDVDNYWFNVTMSTTGLCGTTNIASPAAIFQYVGAPSKKLPTKPGVAPPDSGCVDPTDFVPVVKRQAPVAEFKVTTDNDLDVQLDTSTGTVKWDIKGKAINVTWDEPTLEYIAKGKRTFPPNYNIVQNPAGNKWSFWLVQNLGFIPHPMHLHGHDFLILGRSDPVANPVSVTVDQFRATLAFQPARDTPKLNFNNPARRDVTMLPSWGWIVIAFKTDNPGAWLFHCHIAWHVSQGLGLQFLERLDDIPTALTLGALEPTCDKWTRYYKTSAAKQYDSGL